jgi:diacylglycerol kinase family enzyme
LISCGGDGTLFEVVNGMLEREDGKKLPIGIIPNGSGNAGAGGLGIRDTDMAL